MLGSGLEDDRQIEAAQAAGISIDALMLRLTVADVSRLKRDRELAVSDISFAGSCMRFLGVAVQQQDGAAVSELVRVNRLRITRLTPYLLLGAALW